MWRFIAWKRLAVAMAAASIPCCASGRSAARACALQPLIWRMSARSTCERATACLRNASPGERCRIIDRFIRYWHWAVDARTPDRPTDRLIKASYLRAASAITRRPRVSELCLPHPLQARVASQKICLWWTQFASVINVTPQSDVLSVCWVWESKDRYGSRGCHIQTRWHGGWRGRRHVSPLHARW